MKTGVAIKQWKNSSLYALLTSKELLIVAYFLIFIFGIAYGSGYNFYHGYRILQVSLLFMLGFWALYQRQLQVNKTEGLFFAFIGIGSLFWQQPLFIITDLLLAYLLYKGFQVLNYHALITKAIVLGSFVLFLMLPVGLFDYVNSGTYIANWYPLAWNIRVYNSYFLVLSIFATWFYISTTKYKNIYLLFLFLAFFAVLLDGGRSVTLAYTAFVIIVALCHKPSRLALMLTYISSWFAYVAITYAASFGVSGLRIVRESSSGRIDLWINGLTCWVQHPIMGCGFYQLEQYPHLSAHPHNIFVQVLTETGLIGFGFLVFILFKIARHISWNIKQNYFVIAALLAVSIDMSLSGVHIYPITQMALLWLFVFLLKNPAFSHAQHFNQAQYNASRANRYVFAAVMLVLAVLFGYLVLNTSIFLVDMPATPPRFWGYGYHLL